MQGFWAKSGPSHVGGDTSRHRPVSPCPMLRSPGHGKSAGGYGSAGTSATAQPRLPVRQREG